jgi:uncharacterized protein YgbK (DUF1537 family)
MESIAIIADDLTGAADTGVQFCSFFDETVLVPYHQLSHVLEEHSGSFSQARTIYTNSRALDANAARKRIVAVGRQLSRLQPGWIYKKVDSVLRGNLGAEIETLMDELDYELSFIAPAFPEMGRTTVDDTHKVHGTPVGQTEISRDPVNPVTESRLSLVVAAQSRYPVGHVTLDYLKGDENKLQEEIERQVDCGIRHIAFDTTSRDHLDRIARIVLTSSRRILPVGSAGLAASIGRLLPKRPASNEYGSRVFGTGNHLLVCGTTSEVTRRQIKALIETYPYEEIVFRSDALADRNRRDFILKEASIVQSILFSKNVIIRIDSQPNDRETVKQINRIKVAESVVEGLGFFVASVLKGNKPGFIFVTGGDTADAVLTAVGAKGIRIFGEIVSGMVHGSLIGGIMNNLSFITKAGAFGKKDALVVLHESWAKRG